MKVLVVDDVALVGRTIQRMLRGMATVCDHALTGAAALERHGAVHYDVILLDINLGDATGPVLALYLEKLWPTRVALVSADPETAGWDGKVLAKPFETEDVRMLVAALYAKPLRRRG